MNAAVHVESVLCSLSQWLYIPIVHTGQTVVQTETRGEHTRDSCAGLSQEATKVLGKAHHRGCKWSDKIDHDQDSRCGDLKHPDKQIICHFILRLHPKFPFLDEAISDCALTVLPISPLQPPLSPGYLAVKTLYRLDLNPHQMQVYLHEFIHPWRRFV